MTPEDKAREKARKAASYQRNKAKRAAQGKAYYEANKARIRARDKAYREANREKVLAQQKATGLRYTHGITLQDKQTWYAAQNGACAGCKRPMTFEESRIDHCHATDKRRGLLHHTCNLMIGLAHDSPAVLEALAAYLRRQGYDDDGNFRFTLKRK